MFGVEHDEELPGVTFRLTRADVGPPVDIDRHKALAFVEMQAEINDFGIWDDVIKRLDGMRLYTVNNLAEEMISVAQERAREAEKATEKKRIEAQAEIEKLKQRLSFAEAEIGQLRSVITEQNKELAYLRLVR